MYNFTASKQGTTYLNREEFYKYFKKRNKNFNKEELDKPFKVKKIQIQIFKTIAKNLIEKEGGVFIKGFGYFFILIPPYKSLITTPYKKEGFANFKTKNRTFNPTFLPISNKRKLISMWSMDRGFSTKEVKIKLNRKIVKESRRYKSYPYTLSTLYEFKKPRNIKL